MGYDSWLESGLHDVEVPEPTLSEVVRANRESPYEFEIDSWVGTTNNPTKQVFVMCDNLARRAKIPNNARAQRIRKRQYRRMVKAAMRKRGCADSDWVIYQESY